MATRIRTIDSREYKLLLKPGIVDCEPEIDAANAVWRKHFEKVVEGVLGEGAIHASKSAFTKTRKRKVLFWDTPDGDLAMRNYSLRERSERGSPPELTLKFRTPDLFVASATRLPSTGKTGTTFEEDIAPLAVRSSKGSSSPSVTLPDNVSTRSRFARSAEVETRHPATFGELEELFPTLGKNLLDGGAAAVPHHATELISGSRVREFAFKGITADLGHGYELDFTLSVWIFENDPPNVVEISYKCDADGGQMKRAAAQKSMDLFLRIQKKLQKFIEMDETSKTARALPKRVGAP